MKRLVPARFSPAKKFLEVPPGAQPARDHLYFGAIEQKIGG